MNREKGSAHRERNRLEVDFTNIFPEPRQRTALGERQSRKDHVPKNSDRLRSTGKTESESGKS